MEGADVLTGIPGGRDLLLVYEPLINYAQSGELQPGLAESWKVEPGNKAITLTLRDDAGFSDGTPVTAKAVKTWIDYRATVVSPFDGLVGRVASVKVLGDNVVRVEVKEPNPALPAAFSPKNGSNWGYVVNPKFIERLKKNPRDTSLKQQSAGAGQYVLDPDATVIGDHCTYVPNRHFYDQSKIGWAKVVTRSVADANSVLAALKTGQIDVRRGRVQHCGSGEGRRPQRALHARAAAGPVLLRQGRCARA